MLGRKLLDPMGVESQAVKIEGLGLLDVETTFAAEKNLCQAEASHIASGLKVRGYEIHMGTTRRGSDLSPAFEIIHRRSEGNWETDEGAVSQEGNMWGTYLHGVFDDDRFRRHFIDSIRQRKGLKPLGDIQCRYDTDGEYDKLASVLRESLDLQSIYRLLD